MLNDLAKQRQAAGPVTSVPQPSPAVSAQPPRATPPPLTVPQNLPVSRPAPGPVSPMPPPLVRPTPARAPAPVPAPSPVPRPTIPTILPTPAPVARPVPQPAPLSPQSVPPSAAPLPRPAPAPIPREIPVPPAPKPPVIPPSPVQKVPVPTAPAAPQPYVGSTRTMSSDISNIQVGRPAEGTKAPIIAVPTAPPPLVPAAPAITAPPAATNRRGRTLFIVVVGVLILVILVAIVLSLSSGTSTPTPTPTASPIATLSIPAKSLQSIFGNPTGSVALESDSTAVADFRNATLTAQPALNQAVSLALTRGGSPLSPATFLAAVIPTMPSTITTALGDELTVLVYGQSELYDASGTKISTTTPQNRLVLVVEAPDATAMNQAMQTWETTGLASASASVFGFSMSKASAGAFATGTYRQLSVRYLNFPYADQSLDWGIVLASNGKSYLVIAASRQSFFWTIDQLMQ